MTKKRTKMMRVGTFDWWPVPHCPSTKELAELLAKRKPPLGPAGRLGFPKDFLSLKPDTTTTFFTFGEWVDYQIDFGDGRLRTRFVSPVFDGAHCYTLAIGRVLYREFMEQKTHGYWVKVQRTGLSMDTRYELTSCDEISRAEYKLLEEQAQKTDWTPYDQWPKIHRPKKR